MRTVREENAEEVEREQHEQNPQCDAVSSVHLPVWSGYNSLIHNTKPVTRVSSSGRMARHMQILMSCYGGLFKRERSMKSTQ